MDEILYLECLSGISGDMTVAALLDLGADEEVLRRALSSLPLSGFSVEIKRVVKSGLDVCDFNVVLDEAHENHDHDMEYLTATGSMSMKGTAMTNTIMEGTATANTIMKGTATSRKRTLMGNNTASPKKCTATENITDITITTMSTAA